MGLRSGDNGVEIGNKDTRGVGGESRTEKRNEKGNWSGESGVGQLIGRVCGAGQLVERRWIERRDE